MRIRLDQRAFAFRAIGVVCILLLLFTGFLSAVHVHQYQTNTPDRACSICALIHAGVVPVAAAPPIPVLIAAETVTDSAPQLRGYTVASSLYIRPPPLV